MFFFFCIGIVIFGSGLDLQLIIRIVKGWFPWGLKLVDARRQSPDIYPQSIQPYSSIFIISNCKKWIINIEIVNARLIQIWFTNLCSSRIVNSYSIKKEQFLYNPGIKRDQTMADILIFKSIFMKHKISLQLLVEAHGRPS